MLREQANVSLQLGGWDWSFGVVEVGGFQSELEPERNSETAEQKCDDIVYPRREHKR